MHIVNMKAVHPNLTAALDDPTGLAVLGFFIDVGSNKSFNTSKHLNSILSFTLNLQRLSSFLAGCLRRQRALWTHITEALLCRLQRLEGATCSLNGSVRTYLIKWNKRKVFIGAKSSLSHRDIMTVRSVTWHDNRMFIKSVLFHMSIWEKPIENVWKGEDL